uniref:Uncharacterized protein n=1 Tax=Oryza nivara TaxID=4536 RepID=A0A0E0FP40_ORYNI
MAVGRRGRGDGDGAAMARWWGSPRRRRRGGRALRGGRLRLRRRVTESPDPVAPLARATGDGLGRRRCRSGIGGWPVTGFSGVGSSATTASGRRRLTFVGGGSSPALGGARSGAGCRRPGRGLPICCDFAGDGDGASISLLLFLQIRFPSSLVVLLPVLTGGAAPAPLFLGAPPFLG